MIITSERIKEIVERRNAKDFELNKFEVDLVDTLAAKDAQIKQLENELSQWHDIGDKAATALVYERIYLVPKMRDIMEKQRKALGNRAKESEAKDEQIKQLQQGFMPQLEEALKDKQYYRDMAKQLEARLAIAKEAISKALDNLYCMLPCGSDKDTQYGHIAVDALEQALEALEGSERDGNI